jgi:hypothetical protein
VIILQLRNRAYFHKDDLKEMASAVQKSKQSLEKQSSKKLYFFLLNLRRD